jgi:hypothetical protein
MRLKRRVNDAYTKKHPPTIVQHCKELYSSTTYYNNQRKPPRKVLSGFFMCCIEGCLLALPYSVTPPQQLQVVQRLLVIKKPNLVDLDWV